MILAIDTATPVCSVALHQEGALVAYQEVRIEKSHSGLLAVMIKQLLENAEVKPQDIEAVAVSIGPGSYTGLRIGLSTAKGLCYAWEVPLIDVSTLGAMAFGMQRFIPDARALLCPMIDARRMEVYHGLWDKKGAEIQAPKPLIINPEVFETFSEKFHLYLFGDGAAKCREVLPVDYISIIEDVVPNADFVGRFAWAKFQQQQFADLAYVEPFYLKEFQSHKKAKKA